MKKLGLILMILMMTTVANAQVLTYQADRSVELKEYVADIAKRSNGMYHRLEITHTELFNKIWQSSKFTPKEIVDELGNQGLILFIGSTGVQQLLSAINPSYEVLTVPEGYTVTPNADGSVTISDGTVEEPIEVDEDIYVDEGIYE